MKKIIRNPLFTFVLGAIIFSSVVGVVAYNYNAKDISYTPKDSNWNVDNVEDAIKDLKNNKGYSSLEFVKNSSVLTSNGATSKSENITLEKGNYIFFASCRAAEWGCSISVESNTDSIYSIGANAGFSNWVGNLSTDSYKNGRGAGIHRTYQGNITSNNSQITFTVTGYLANNGPFNGVGVLSIYKLN